ncbi:MAG: CbiX/SirB N-terminal domain-containing protein [Sandaracinaceae bacterium]|nr:CbiX/SirB N-terminal domain-containing protein [Sandaracinaceae bacterium]
MRGYLLVDHGSRLEAANQLVEDVAHALGRRLGPEARVAFAHQEMASPSIDEAIAALAREGVRELVVVPFFLAPGRHATVDVPRLAREAVARHAGLSLELCAPPLPARPDDLASLVFAFLAAR